MPSGRFLNLPEEKQRRILKAAFNEFVRAPYNEASINRIIQAAGIPRGSFYQYFESKQDLLEHITESVCGNVSAAIESVLRENGGDLFGLFPTILARIIQVAGQVGCSDFFRNIFSCTSMGDARVLALVCPNAQEMINRFGHLLDGRLLQGRTPEWCADYVEILIILLQRSVIQYLAGNQPPDAVEAAFRRKVEILKDCICAKGDEA